MPNHWQETTFGEIADVRVGAAFKSKIYRACPQGIPLVRGMNLGPNGLRWDETFFWPESDLDSYEKYLLDQGQTLVAMDATFTSDGKIRAGTVGQDDLPLLLNQRVAAISAGSSVLSGFVYLLVASDDFRRFLSNRQTGAFAPHISKKDITGFPLPLPPLAEQRRIVDLVGSIDAYIDALEAQIDATRTARTSVLSELLSNPSEDWQETTLGEIAEVVSGGTPKTKIPEYWNGEIVWVTPTEVVAQEGRIITTSDRMITQEGLDGSSAKMLPVDAVLLTSRATIGAVALAGVPLATNQGFASLVCGDQLLPRFAMYWCQANTHELVSRAGGNTFLEISRKKVAAIPLSVPPLAEQQRIVDLVVSVDEQISGLELQVGAVRELRSGVLSELLSGERLLTDDYDVAVGL